VLYGVVRDEIATVTQFLPARAITRRVVERLERPLPLMITQRLAHKTICRAPNGTIIKPIHNPLMINELLRHRPPAISV
jgi:hypothetical protein